MGEPIFWFSPIPKNRETELFTDSEEKGNYDFDFHRFQRKGKLCFWFSPIPKKRETMCSQHPRNKFCCVSASV